METVLIIAIAAPIGLSIAAYFAGKKAGNNSESSEKLSSLEATIEDLKEKNSSQGTTIREQGDQIKNLTSDYNVEKTNANNAKEQLERQREEYERQRKQETERTDRLLLEKKREFESQLKEQKESYEKRLTSQKAENDEEKHKTEALHNKAIADLKESYEGQIHSLKESSEKQNEELKDSYTKQLNQAKLGFDEQLNALREMNEKQVKDQLKLIEEKMRTTSEDVLKARQKELGEQNTEQVSKIIDPLQKSLKDMENALNDSKLKQKEALDRLDETIKQNMANSTSLGETADRLTRALTGEVKVQGNFGELKLKQLLEDLELKEGEQFDTQETLRNNVGKGAKGDDGKGLIPDFILHFPNNRHVVVDSKMSLTDYERYMNTEDGSPEKSEHLKTHIASVRMQVKRLAKKEYTKYLPAGYNKLNFAIMYVPIEGALNLAILNDGTLWREAYDQGVLILGPQTMYMNLRVLEMMWTQVRQLKNQQIMIEAASSVIDRVQDFGQRFIEVETSMNDTVKKMSKLKITTADNGQSIITAAKKLLSAGAQENKKKKRLADIDDSLFIEEDSTLLLSNTPVQDVTEEQSSFSDDKIYNPPQISDQRLK